MEQELYRKKLKAEYEYLKMEHQYQNHIYNQAIQAFNEYFKDKIDLKTDKETVEQKISKRKKLKPTVKKIYKKLAQKLHPDKVGGSEKAFQELQKSIDDKNIDRVIELAEEYDVDIQSTIETEEFYKQNISDLQDRIKEQNTTLAMLWYRAEESSKDQLEQKIISHYRRVNNL